MIFRFLFSILVLLILLPNIAVADDSIDTITFLEGEAFRIVGGEETALKAEDSIHLNNEIRAGNNARLEITFKDETTLVLGSETKLVIDKYIYDPDNAKSNAAKFSITKGPFHYISGLLAKKEKPDVTIDLDFGSIGIRGTKIWRDMVVGENNIPQCRIYIEDGKVRVSNGLGITTLEHGEGTKISGRTHRPTIAKPWGEGAISDIKSKTALPVTEKTHEKVKENITEPETTEPPRQEEAQEPPPPEEVKNLLEDIPEEPIEEPEQKPDEAIEQEEQPSEPLDLEHKE